MLTPSDDARLQAAEGSERGNLSIDLEPVQQRLFAMGAAWRGSLPEADRLATFAQDLPPHPVALDRTEITHDLDEHGAHAEFTGSAPRGENPMKWRNKRAIDTMDTKHEVEVNNGATTPIVRQRVSPPVHTLLAGAAAVLIVGLLATTFAVFSHRSTSRVGATATSTSAPSKSWSAVASLSSTNTFALAVPAIAPSDPRIVYKVADSPHLALQRTADGGATWQTLSLPVQNASNFMQLYVSPLNPNVLVLHTDGWTTPPGPQGPQGNVGIPSTDSSITSSTDICNYQAMSWVGTPANKATTSPLGDLSSEVPTGPNLPCSQFLSTNGGRSWTQTSTFFDSARILSAGGGGSGIFMVQGNRLYAYDGFTCLSGPTYVCAGGLLVSLDGGKTWSPAPTPSSRAFCGIGMEHTGTVMFAITSSQCGEGNAPSDNTVWRSDDAGAHWAPVSHLQFSAVDDLHVVSNPGAQYPTVYLTTTDVANPQSTDFSRTTHVQMSQDGGLTWSAVPTEGLPTGWSATDVVAQTSDGSVIALFGPSGSAGVELYSWRPGDSSWQLLAHTPRSSAVLYLVTSSGADTLWAVSVPAATVGGVPFTSVVYRLQL